jgi:hypothetical protein
MSIWRVRNMRTMEIMIAVMVGMVASVSLLDASQQMVACSSSSLLSSHEVPFSIIIEDGQSRAHTLPRVIVRGTSYTASKAYCTFTITNAEKVRQSETYYLDEDIRTILKKLFFPSKPIQGKGTKTEPYVYACDASQDLEYAAALLVANYSEPREIAELSLESIQKILSVSQQEAQRVCEYLWFCYVVLTKTAEDYDEAQVQLWEDLVTALHVCLLKVYTSQMKGGGKTINQLKQSFEALDEEFLKRQNKFIPFKPFAEDFFDHLKGNVLPLKFEKSDVRDSKKGASLKTPPTRGPSSEEGSLSSSTPEVTPRSGRADRVIADDARDTFSSRGRSRMSPPKIVVEQIAEEEHAPQINLGEYAAVGSPRHGNQSEIGIPQDSCLISCCRRYRKTAIALATLVLGGLGIGVWKVCQKFA